MFGLAVGDAVGTTLEFRPPGSFEPISDMIGGGPFKLEPGQWTDDTSMALCLADSLVQMQGFDPTDQMERYVRWMDHGYLSSNGRCFDIGNTVQGALRKFLDTGEPYSGSTDAYSAGNGSLMRLAPIPLAFYATPAEAIQRAAQMSRTTHGARAAVDACRYYCGLMIGALAGASKKELLGPAFEPVPGLRSAERLAPEIETVALGSFRTQDPPDIAGTGYVVKSMEAALWAFHKGRSFEESVLLAANLGDDADTTAAICGQLAGAFHGLSGIPERWLAKVALPETIESLTSGLARLAGIRHG